MYNLRHYFTRESSGGILPGLVNGHGFILAAGKGARSTATLELFVGKFATAENKLLKAGRETLKSAMAALAGGE